MASAFERKTVGDHAQTVAEPVKEDAASASTNVGSPEDLTPLQRAQQKLQEMRASGDLVFERLNPVEKSKKHPTSLRKAIDAMCWDCQGAGADPNVRQAVRDCGVTQCPLHHLRPWQSVLGKSPDEMSEEEFAAESQNHSELPEEELGEMDEAA